jgi:glycosyltransferase involved in cell wall biosynthesis
MAQGTLTTSISAERRDQAAAAGAALRVAAVIDAASVSGPGRQLGAIATSLRDEGVDFQVLLFHRDGCPSNAYAEYLAQASVPHVVIRERGRGDPGALVALRRELERLRPDVVQSHGYKPTTFVWMLRRLGLDARWVAFYHGRTDENAKVRLYNRVHEFLLRRADEVVVMSARHRVEMRTTTGEARVIYNAVLDLRPRPDLAFRQALASCTVPAPRVLALGRLSPEKGVDVLLASLRLLRDAARPMGALVVGDGPERERLGQQASALGLAGDCAFLPATPDITAAYGAADIVVLPSRSEGLPNVLLEAMAHDRPVVATDVGAVREVLGDSKAGVIVPPGDARALADGIARALALVSDPAAAADRREVAARFSLAGRTAAHLEMYESLLGRPVARGGSHG